jgi:acyl-CoA thioesterase FadM
MPFVNDDLNPKFVFFSPVRTARVDLAEVVDHAIIALDGHAPLGGDCCIERLGPAAESSALRVDLWVNDLDDKTCTYGFVVSSQDGRTAVARGERSVVTTDWTRDVRIANQELLKDLPAYA